MASLPRMCIKLLSMYVHTHTHIYGINQYGSKQKSIVGGTWICEHVCVRSAPSLPAVHIHAQGATASCSSCATSRRLITFIWCSAESGSGSQWLPCYWVTLFKSSFSPFKYVLRVKTQIAIHLQEVIIIIHWIQSTWIWKIWTLVWLWLWLRAYMIVCKSLNFSGFILPYLQDWMLFASHALLLPALVSCYTHMSSCGGNFRQAVWFHHYLCKQKAMAVFWLVKVKQQWVFIHAHFKVEYQIHFFISLQHFSSTLFYILF